MENTTSEELVCDNVYLHSRDTGARSIDPKKYFKDGEKLQKQFFDTLYDDPDGLNNRSVFYAAQSYMDACEFDLALKWYNLYLKILGGWTEQYFEANTRIARILIQLKKPYEEIETRDLLRKMGYRANGTWTMKEILDAVRELEERYLKKQCTKKPE